MCMARDGGVMVSIVAFQAVDPGSIPGHRTFFLTPKNTRNSYILQ